MRLVTSAEFDKKVRRFDRKTRELVARKVSLLLIDKTAPSLRYKAVRGLVQLQPPVKEISVTYHIRITLQEFEDYIYLRNIGGHGILP